MWMNGQCHTTAAFPLKHPVFIARSVRLRAGLEMCGKCCEHRYSIPGLFNQ